MGTEKFAYLKMGKHSKAIYVIQDNQRIRLRNESFVYVPIGRISKYTYTQKVPLSTEKHIERVDKYVMYRSEDTNDEVNNYEYSVTEYTDPYSCIDFTSTITKEDKYLTMTVPYALNGKVAASVENNELKLYINE